MTTKYYLDKAGLEALVNNINTQIENFKVAVATAEEAGIIKPGLGLVVENDGTLSISDAYTDQILA